MVARQFPHDGALLLQEPPLVLLPALAAAIGVTSALLLQQLHYWLRRPGGLDHEGRHWVYLTIDEWHRQMPFLSGRTMHVPPHSIEAEQSVLGGLMLVGEAWDQIADRLVEDDFYRREHQLIFRAIGDLASTCKP